MKHFIYVYLFLLSTVSYAQEFGSAIVIDEPAVNSKFADVLIQSFKAAYQKNNPAYTDFYVWDKNQESAPKSYPSLNNDDFGTRPITTIVYFNTNYRCSHQLVSKYDVDTTGKVTAMYLGYDQKIAPYVKVVDAVSSEVLQSKIYDLKEWQVSTMYKVDNFAKYFGKNPKKLEATNRRRYQEGMALFKEKELKSLNNFYKKKIANYGKNMGDLANIVKSVSDKRLFQPIEFQYNDKDKLDEFFIDATGTDNLSVNDALAMYKKTKINRFEQYEPVAPFAHVRVVSVDGDNIKVKPFSLGRKKMTAASKSGDDIVFARNEQLIKAANSNGQSIKRVQIKENCSGCSDYILRTLLSVPNIRIIDRTYEGPNQYFTNGYKNEKFVDYDMSKLQDKKQGVDYIFEASNGSVKATDVATGRLASTDRQKASGLLSLLDNTAAQTLNVVMDIMQTDIEILEILKEKKGKIKKVLAYNPLGFSRITTLNILIVNEEKVGSRTIKREKNIGKCWIRNPKSETIAELAIAKGDKELYQALQAGEKITFRVKL